VIVGSWSKRPVFLVGGGPSLHGFDFARLEGRGIVCGINQSALDLEFCDAGISLDWRFITERHHELCQFAQRRPFFQVTSVREQLIPGAVQIIDAAEGRSLTSGHAALRLALIKGATKIILLGFDYYIASGRRNYHVGYSWHSPDNDRSLARWAQQFVAIDGVEILNASPDSLITVYPKIAIDQVLA
jgi:hypothetical protein